MCGFKCAAVFVLVLKFVFVCTFAWKSQVRLVRSQPSSTEFQNSFEESFNVYRRYQMAIHGDSESKCTESQYKRFLVKSPLEVERIKYCGVCQLHCKTLFVCFSSFVMVVVKLSQFGMEQNFISLLTL